MSALPHAVIDVFATEPATESPLFGLPNVVVTPHLGASTTEAMTLSAGSPVTVMPIEANSAGFDRSTPGFGKIMCLL